MRTSKSSSPRVSKPINVKPGLERLEAREVPSISISASVNWNQDGPQTITGGQSSGIGATNPVIGAISALAAHPTDPNVMLAGTPNGGVWISTNAQAASPNWTPISDQLASLSISDIAFDPINPNRVIVGFGNTADGAAEDNAMDPTRNGVRGDLIGVMVCENILAPVPAWQVIGGQMAGKDVKNVVLRPGYMVVSTDQGIFYSSNGGATFTNTYAMSEDNGITYTVRTVNERIFDVATNPRLPNQIYMVTGGPTPKIWRSDNGGQSWGSVTDPMMQMNARTVNVKITVRDVGEVENQVYIAVSNNQPVQGSQEDQLLVPPLVFLPDANFAYTSRNASLVSVCWSTNQGGNWTRMDLPKQATVAHRIHRIALVDGVMTITTDPTNPFFAGFVPARDQHRLKDGDIVRLSGLIDTADPPNPVYPNQYFFVRVIDDYSFQLVGATTDPNISYIPADANPPFPDIPSTPATWTRIVNANPGEKSQFLTLLADPSAEQRVYVGGDMSTYNFFAATTTGATTYTNSLWSGNRFTSPAGGTKGSSKQWSTMTNAGSTGGAAPAADSREMIFDANGNMWLATGAGIYRKPNPSTNSAWVSVSGDIRVGQFWSANYNSVSGLYFGGTQDTGMVEQTAKNSTTYRSYLTTAARNRLYDQESAYRSDVDNTTLPGQSIQYVVGKDFGQFRRRVYNAAGALIGDTALTFGSPSNPLPLAGIIAVDQYEGVTDNIPVNDALNQPLTIAFQLNQNDRRRGIYGRTRVYEDSDPAGVTGAIVNDVTPAGMTGNVTAFMYGGLREGIRFNQVLYVGTSTGQLWVRGEFGTTSVNRAPVGPGAVTDVIRNEDDWRNVYVLKGGRVYESFDAGVNWADVTSNLVGAVDPTTGGPVTGTLTTEIRTLTLWDPNPGSSNGGVVLLAGGRGGVYRKLVGAGCSTGWGEYGNGLPNTVVTDLNIQGNRLIAGTFGRGIWSIDDVTPTLINPITLTVTGTAGSDFMSLSADPNNSNNFIVSDGVNTKSFAYGDVSTVEFVGLGGADTLLVDSNHLAPGGNVRFMRVSVTANMGGDVDDQIIVNNESDTTNEVVTVTGNTIGGFAGDTFFADGCGTITYSGLQNGTLYVNTGLNNDLVNVGGLSAARSVFYSSGGDDTVLTSTGVTGNMVVVDSTGNNRVFVVGGVTDDNFTVSDGGVSANGTLNINYVGTIQNTFLQGQGGLNSVTSVGTSPLTNFTVNHIGGYDGSSTGLSTIVNFTTIQNYGVVGGSGADTLRWQDTSGFAYGSASNPESGAVYTPSINNSGRLVTAFGGITTLAFANLNGFFSVNGDVRGTGARDTLVVVGATTAGLPASYGEILSPNGSDNIVATDAFVTVSNAHFGVLKGVNFENGSGGVHSYRNIFVRGGNEAGTGDVFVATPTLRTNLMLDGGLPETGSVPGDTITAVYSGARTIVPTPAGAFGPAHNRFTQVSNKSDFGYYNFESDPPVPPPPPPVPGVPPPLPPIVPSQIFAVGSEAGVPATVKVYNSQTGALRYQLQPFGAFTGGARVATGDVTGDAITDFVAVAGAGGGPLVNLYDGANGKLIRSFFAFEQSMNKGLYVAIGDTNADGFGDIVVSSGAGQAARVRVYDGASNALLRTFQPYAAGFTGGVRVAVGDIDGDGASDIVTGAGPGGGPHVQVFNGRTNAAMQSFMAYAPSFSLGIYVAAGDVDGDGRADIITGPDVGGGAHVQVFQGLTSTPIRGFFVGEPTVPNQQPITVGSGVRVAAHDIDGDGVVEILTGRGRGVRPLAQMIKVSSRNPVTGAVTGTLSTPLSVNAFGDAYLDGIFVG